MLPALFFGQQASVATLDDFLTQRGQIFWREFFSVFLDVGHITSDGLELASLLKSPADLASLAPAKEKGPVTRVNWALCLIGITRGKDRDRQRRSCSLSSAPSHPSRHMLRSRCAMLASAQAHP